MEARPAEGQPEQEFHVQEWKEVRLGDVATIIVSNVDKKKRDGESPVRLCNYTDVYNRDSIEPSQEFMEATATLAQIKKFGIRVGDVLITKDSETADDIAVPTYVAETADDLVCGYHLAIIRHGKEIDGRFLKSYFELPHTRYYFGSRANGVTRFGLTIDGIRGAKLHLPPLAEQRKIAKILSTWDQAIKTTNALLATVRTQKRAIMQSLLTRKRRFPEFIGQPWATEEFGEIFATANNKKTHINKRDYQDTGRIPVIDQGKEFIGGYTNQGITYDAVPIILFGDHTREVKWVDFSFCPGADGAQLLKTKPGLVQKFGFYLLQNLELPDLGYSRHMRELKKSVFEFPISVLEQARIVSVLDDQEGEVLLLEHCVAKLQTEKKTLMQQLMTGKRRVTI